MSSNVNEEAVELAQVLFDDIREGLGHFSATGVVVGGPESAGTDFVIEGSVHASGKRLRLGFAFLEGANRHRIWSEKSDQILGNVFRTAR